VLDPVAYHRDVLPERAAGPLGAVGAKDLQGVQPLALDIEGDVWTYRPASAGIEIEPGDHDAATLVSLSRASWSDLVTFMRTVPAPMLADELTYRRGGFEHLARWEPALRAIYCGMPIYDPADVDLTDRLGRPLDLTGAFTTTDDPDDLRRFLAQAGYLHVRSVFTPAEIAELNEAVDELSARARPGDDRSWWASDAAGREILCRLVYANLGSPGIAGIEDDPRLRDLVALSGHDLAPAPDRMEGHDVLLKVPGKVRGLANIPWHVDCGLGGHPVFCPSLAIGIQLTPADERRGRIEAIAGSHGTTCRYGPQAHIAIDTEPGDVTVHYADLMHASPPPRGEGGRRVLYVTYYPPAMKHWIGPGQAVNDLVRDRQAVAAGMAGVNPGKLNAGAS
jgi:hypothetical protein